MAFMGRWRRRRAKEQAQQQMGLTRPEDIERVASRIDMPAFGIRPSDIPESAPDPEEIARAARRRALSRRRSGRMSTILTAGLGASTQPLGG